MKRNADVHKLEPVCSRPRTAHADGVHAHKPDGSAQHFPPPGCEASEWISERSLILRHGSSLALMADVSEWLNRSQEFSEVDPSADWDKWAGRRPGFSLSYYCLIDPSLDGQDAIVACLRVVLDGIPDPTPPHRPRMIIDYVTTAKHRRGTGIAGLLTTKARADAQACGANLYVLALESSCVYWMGHDFVLAEEKNINARLNIFPDTHLLRLASDPADVGGEDDLSLSAPPRGGAEEGGGGEEDEEEDEEEATQLAIALSLSARSSANLNAAVEPEPEPYVEDADEEDDDDEEMRAAIALSLAS